MRQLNNRGISGGRHFAFPPYRYWFDRNRNITLTISCLPCPQPNSNNNS
jgi:hypothetical protein